MLFRLRLAHRLLLIYLLSFVSVAVLAYSLIVEKNIAIDFAQKEQRGNAYVAVVRDTLLAIIDDRLASTTPGTESHASDRTVLRNQLTESRCCGTAIWPRYGYSGPCRASRGPFAAADRP